MVDELIVARIYGRDVVVGDVLRKGRSRVLVIAIEERSPTHRRIHGVTVPRCVKQTYAVGMFQALEKLGHEEVRRA